MKKDAQRRDEERRGSWPQQQAVKLCGCILGRYNATSKIRKT